MSWSDEANFFLMYSFVGFCWLVVVLSEYVYICMYARVYIHIYVYICKRGAALAQWSRC